MIHAQVLIAMVSIEYGHVKLKLTVVLTLREIALFQLAFTAYCTPDLLGLSASRGLGVLHRIPVHLCHIHVCVISVCAADR